MFVRQNLVEYGVGGARVTLLTSLGPPFSGRKRAKRGRSNVGEVDISYTNNQPDKREQGTPGQTLYGFKVTLLTAVRTTCLDDNDLLKHSQFLRHSEFNDRNFSVFPRLDLRVKKFVTPLERFPVGLRP